MKLRLLLPLVTCLIISRDLLVEGKKSKNRTNTRDQVSQVLTQVAKDEGENVRVKIEKIDDYVIVETLPPLFPPMNNDADSSISHGNKEKKMKRRKR